MAEIDVPIDEFNNYDKVKGVQYGVALNKSAASKGQGSHGLPGGFGIGGAQMRGRGKGRTEDEEMDAFRQIAAGDFGNAVKMGKVLGKQTLGGQMVTSDGTNPQYLVGTFRHGKTYLFEKSSELLLIVTFRSTPPHACQPHSPNAPAIPSHRCPCRTKEIFVTPSTNDYWNGWSKSHHHDGQIYR